MISFVLLASEATVNAAAEVAGSGSGTPAEAWSVGSWIVVGLVVFGVVVGILREVFGSSSDEDPKDSSDGHTNQWVPE